MEGGGAALRGAAAAKRPSSSGRYSSHGRQRAPVPAAATLLFSPSALAAHATDMPAVDSRLLDSDNSVATFPGVPAAAAGRSPSSGSSGTPQYGAVVLPKGLAMRRGLAAEQPEAMWPAPPRVPSCGSSCVPAGEPVSGGLDSRAQAAARLQSEGWSLPDRLLALAAMGPQPAAASSAGRGPSSPRSPQVHWQGGTPRISSDALRQQQQQQQSIGDGLPNSARSPLIGRFSPRTGSLRAGAGAREPSSEQGSASPGRGGQGGVDGGGPDLELLSGPVRHSDVSLPKDGLRAPSVPAAYNNAHMNRWQRSASAAARTKAAAISGTAPMPAASSTQPLAGQAAAAGSQMPLARPTSASKVRSTHHRPTSARRDSCARATASRRPPTAPKEAVMPQLPLPQPQRQDAAAATAAGRADAIPLPGDSASRVEGEAAAARAPHAVPKAAPTAQGSSDSAVEGGGAPAALRLEVDAAVVDSSDADLRPPPSCEISAAASRKAASAATSKRQARPPSASGAKLKRPTTPSGTAVKAHAQKRPSSAQSRKSTLTQLPLGRQTSGDQLRNERGGSSAPSSLPSSPTGASSSLSSSERKLPPPALLTASTAAVSASGAGVGAVASSSPKHINVLKSLSLQSSFRPSSASFNKKVVASSQRLGPQSKAADDSQRCAPSSESAPAPTLAGAALPLAASTSAATTTALLRPSSAKAPAGDVEVATVGGVGSASATTTTTIEQSDRRASADAASSVSPSGGVPMEAAASPQEESKTATSVPLEAAATAGLFAVAPLEALSASPAAGIGAGVDKAQDKRPSSAAAGRSALRSQIAEALAISRARGSSQAPRQAVKTAPAAAAVPKEAFAKSSSSSSSSAAQQGKAETASAAATAPAAALQPRRPLEGSPGPAEENHQSSDGRPAVRAHTVGAIAEADALLGKPEKALKKKREPGEQAPVKAIVKMQLRNVGYLAMDKALLSAVQAAIRGAVLEEGEDVVDYEEDVEVELSAGPACMRLTMRLRSGLTSEDAASGLRNTNLGKAIAGAVRGVRGISVASSGHIAADNVLVSRPSPSETPAARPPSAGTSNSSKPSTVSTPAAATAKALATTGKPPAGKAASTSSGTAAARVRQASTGATQRSSQRMATAPARPSSVPAAGVRGSPARGGLGRASSKGRGGAKNDNESCSEGEEEAELRLFWQRLKRNQEKNTAAPLKPSAALHGQLEVEPSPLSKAVAALFDAPGARNPPKQKLLATAMAKAAATAAAAAAALSSKAAGVRKDFASATPQSAQAFTFTASRRLEDFCGRGGWAPFARSSAWETDLTFEILCFLGHCSIGRLTQTFTGLRAACSQPLEGGGRRIVLPHLHLCTKSAGELLRRAWMPRVLCLEAMNLGTAARGDLLEAFRRSDQAPRALVSLDLTHTRLGSDSAELLVGVLRGCWGLRSLNLNQANLKDEGVENLADGLVFNPTTGNYDPHRALRCLSLRENGFTDAAGPALATLLRGLPLEHFDLAQNQLGDGATRCLAHALVGNETKAKAVSADCSCFICRRCAAVATPKALAARPSAVVRSPLKRPTSSSKAAKPAAVPPVCEPIVYAVAASSNHRLARLNLAQNEVTATGFMVLAGALGVNRTLESLDIGGNEFLGKTLAELGEPEQDELANGLCMAKSLRDLHLWKCGLGDVAFRVLAKAQPPHLELLNLSMNRFSPSLKDALMRELTCGTTAAVRV
eukprot:TRINITY_DN8274_c0_g1_i1.p1 TRINITY_DN8274_c0_g1~~TRINITY_DN8274_c0_g1_i1.p1  ORF type:complete len:1713 (-),score=434.82 TRINITY_DN8274_c0_g1_i1:103-5241(-)